MSLKSSLEKIAGWFQPTYNKIEEWDLPWLRDLCRSFWNIVDNETKKKIYDFVMLVCAKYGEDKAKEVLNSVLKLLHLEQKK
jgi:hypothetical protein